MAPPPDENPPPDAREDFAFTAPEHRLISAYLRCRLAARPLPADAGAFFHDADVYAAEPAALTAGLRPAPARKGEGSCSWFFFTPVRAKSSGGSRRSRTVGGGAGTWHSERAPELVLDDEGNRVGRRHYFSYKRKVGGTSVRSGWCMMEYVGDREAGHDGGDSVLALCKIYQAHASSHRADGSASRASSSRSARKRKATEERVDKASASPVRRRLFAPSSLPPPAASQYKISTASEAILSSRSEPEASKGTPRSVLSFWSDCQPEASSSPIFSTPEPEAFDWGFSSAGGTPAAPVPCYGTTNLMDCGHIAGVPVRAPGAVISDSWLRGDDTIASCSADMVPTSGQGKSITTPESLPSSSTPEPEAPRSEAATLDWSFLTASGGAPPALEHWYGGEDLGARTCASWATGSSDTTTSFSGEMEFVVGGLPTSGEWGVSGFAGMPSAAAPSSWCSGRDLSDGWLREQMPWTVA